MRTMPFRFSLASLMGAVLVTAVACASLRFASELWGSALLTVTIGMLLVGVLGMVLRRGAARAFWFGFTLFGSAYLILVFAPWFYSNVRPQLLTSKLLSYLHQKTLPPAAIAGSMGDVDADGDLDLYVANDPTANLVFSNAADPELRLVASRGKGVVTGDFDGDGYVDLFVTNLTGAPNTLYRNLGNGMFEDVTTGAFVLHPGPSWEHFEQVGHSLSALLVALLGGLLARYVFARRSLTDDASGS